MAFLPAVGAWLSAAAPTISAVGAVGGAVAGIAAATKKAPRRPGLPAPQATGVPDTAVRKDTFAQLAKRRRAAVMSQMTGEPATLRRKLGGT